MSLPNFARMDAVDGTSYGSHNTIKMVNPYKTYFVAEYGDKKVNGNDLFNTGWNELPDGITLLSYVLSTGLVIEIPKHRAYLPMIDCSVGVDMSRIFNSINVNCLGDDSKITTYKIFLKEDKFSKFKIGDIVISNKNNVDLNNKYWKMGVF